MIMENIPFLVKGDVLKFVVGTEEDLTAMKAVVDEYVPNPHTFETFNQYLAILAPNLVAIDDFANQYQFNTGLLIEFTTSTLAHSDKNAR